MLEKPGSTHSREIRCKTSMVIQMIIIHSCVNNCEDLVYLFDYHTVWIPYEGRYVNPLHAICHDRSYQTTTAHASYAPINSKVEHPPRAIPRAFELLKIGLFKFSPLAANKAFKCPTN